MVSQLTTPQRSWVLLSYRLPREPSTPRIAVWRKLRKLGVVQIGDGLVALPAEPRTVEHLEWIAEAVIEADGSATVWNATPTDGRDGGRLVAAGIEARNQEYDELLADMATAGRPVDRRTLARWRRTFGQIQSRDHFGADRADVVRATLLEAAGTNVAVAEEAGR